MLRYAIFFVALGGLAMATTSCKDAATKQEQKVLGSMIGTLEAIEGAMERAPKKADGFTLPPRLALRICQPDGSCGDGGKANARVVGNLERAQKRFRKLLAVAEGRGKASDRFNLKWASKNTLRAWPAVRYVGVAMPDKVRQYDKGYATKARWVGRVALWDVRAGKWRGAVKVDLVGSERKREKHHYLRRRGNMEEYLVLPGRTKTAAQMDFDGLLYMGIKAAVVSGRDVTRADQALRFGTGSKAALESKVKLSKDITLIRDKGRLLAVADGQLKDLGIPAIAEVWPTATGLLTQRSNARPKDPKLRMVQLDGRILDASFAAAGRMLRIHGTDPRGRPWLAVGKSKAGAALVATWTAGDWKALSLEAAQPAPKRIRDIAHGVDGKTVYVLGGAQNKVWLWVGGEGRAWRAVPLSIWAMHIAAARDGSIWLSGQGIHRIADLADPKPTRLTRNQAAGLFQLRDGGLIVAIKGRRFFNPTTFAVAAGSKLRRIAGLKTRKCFDVADDGTIGVYHDRAFALRTPDGKITRARLPGGVDLGSAVCSLKVDGAQRLWTITSAGPTVMVDGALKVLRAKGSGSAAAGKYADVAVRAKGSSLKGFVPLL